ncbi:MAG: hypothetical protein AAF335_04370 [Bacteroidota bacterium]
MTTQIIKEARLFHISLKTRKDLYQEFFKIKSTLFEEIIKDHLQKPISEDWDDITSLLSESQLQIKIDKEIIYQALGKAVLHKKDNNNSSIDPVYIITNLEAYLKENLEEKEETIKKG